MGKARKDNEDLEETASIAVGQHIQQQKRFTLWSAMGIGHSITNTAIAIIVGLASGVAFGGPPVFFYGFILMAIVALFVAISLGELSSAFPHPGGQCFWVATLAPPRFRRFLSYITGIMAWAGALCTTASVCLAVPIIVFNMSALASPSFHYEPWMGFVGYQVTNILAFFFNLFERVLPWASRVTLAYTITAVTVVFVALLAGNTEKQSAQNFFVRLYNISGWSDPVAFILGLNPCSWAFSCLDAVVHLADEIPEPRRNIPKALLCTVALGTFTGFPIIIALFFSATELDTVATSGTPSLQIFYQVFHNNTAAAIGLQTLVTISAAASIIGLHTWQSRIAWVFGGDKGFPFHRYLSQITLAPFDTPIWAHLWSCCWTAALGCLYLGSTLAFNSLVAGGILLQYLTYAISVACLLYHGRSRVDHGPFWFPKLGYVANIVTLVWTVFALVFFSFPSYLPVRADQMNYVSCVIVGVLVYAVSYWILYGRRRYRLPERRIYD